MPRSESASDIWIFRIVAGSAIGQMMNRWCADDQRRRRAVARLFAISSTTNNDRHAPIRIDGCATVCRGRPDVGSKRHVVPVADGGTQVVVALPMTATTAMTKRLSDSGDPDLAIVSISPQAQTALTYVRGALFNPVSLSVMAFAVCVGVGYA